MNELYDGLILDSCLYWTNDLSNQNTLTHYGLEKEFNLFDDISPWDNPSTIADSKKYKKLEKLKGELKLSENNFIASTFNEQDAMHGNVDSRKIATKKGKKRNLKLRSRFGCEECKNRRIKCDEEKPLCKRCHAKGLQCKYKILFQFREDYEIKGKKFGREGVWNKTGLLKKITKELISSLKDAHYLNIYNSNALAFVNFTVEDFLQGKPWIPHSVQLSLIPVDIRDRIGDNLIGFALTYFIDVVSPIFNPFGFRRVKNKYTINLASKQVLVEEGLNLKWLIQYCQSNTSIFYLVIALGFIYLSKNCSRNINYKDAISSWLASSHVFMNKGMQLVKKYMLHFQTTNDSHPNVHFSTDFILHLVFLMLYELANNCNEKWRFYLKTCKCVLRSECFEQPKNDIEMHLLRFALELLNYQETMGRTACKDKNSFFLVNGDDDDEEKRNLYFLQTTCLRISWMGCDRYLVDAISDITDLSLERFNNIRLEDYTILCSNLKNRLRSMYLGHNIGHYFLDNLPINFDDMSSFDNFGVFIFPTLNIENFCFVLVYEVKRLVALIYLECCLLNAKPEDHYIQTMIFKVYKALTIIIIKNDFKWASTLLWPIFIAGVEISVHSSECEVLRYLTLKMLDKIQPKSLGNVGMIREIILGIWKSRDIQNCNENSFGYMKKHNAANEMASVLGIRNDWETFVANESYKVSLA